MARPNEVVCNRIRRDEFVWALGSFCALNRIPFAPELVLKEFPPPYTTDSVVQAVRALGFKIREIACDAPALAKLKFPCLTLLQEASVPAETATADVEEKDALGATEAEVAGEAPTSPENRLAIVFEASVERIVYFEGNSNTPTIYDNLVMANPHATFEQIVQACTMAEIHQVIEQLPKGSCGGYTNS